MTVERESSRDDAGGVRGRGKKVNGEVEGKLAILYGSWFFKGDMSAGGGGQA